MPNQPPGRAAGANPEASGDGKILGIELLRFASALAVLVFHYQHLAYVGTSNRTMVVTAQPFYSLLGFLYRNGFYGVEVFWCISGFIFFWKYGAPIAARRVPGREFFWLRLSRLYPLHFATLLFMGVLQQVYLHRTGSFFVYHYNDWYHFALQLLMASNWGLQVGDSFNGPIWSISIEVLVYETFFLSLRYISGSWLMLGGVCLIAMLVQASKFTSHPYFACLMYFYAGCLTARLYLQVGRQPKLRPWVAAAALLAIVGILLLNLWLPVRPKYFLLVCAPAFIYLCVSYIRASGVVERLLVPAGNMTYSSYLLHVPLQITIVTVCLYAGISVRFTARGFFAVHGGDAGALALDL